MVVGLATVRYVKALFRLAKARGEQDAVREHAERFGAQLAASPELTQLVRDPLVAVAVKKRVLRQVGAEAFPPSLLDFVDYALDAGRPEVVVELAEEYARLDRDARGVVAATVRTAKPLDEATRGAITARLEEFTGKSVQWNEEVVPELIGGITIQIGSRLYDGSVKRRLDDLEKHLRSSRIE